MEVKFDKYYDNEELQKILAAYAQNYPDFVELTTLGKSYEGRDIPLLILNNKNTGAHREKPAFWLDGNLHATEVCGTSAVVYIIERLLQGYGKNRQITRILDEQAIYAAPRLNPDGAALALGESRMYLRSGTRPYPFREKKDGLHTEDVDGDGRILQMRIEDPCGDWKISAKDPRLMEKRELDEEGGTYYRLFPEGTIRNYDGHLIKIASSFQGLDFNRNFPWFWRPEGEQLGAGDYPVSEPEVRAIVDFITRHRNIYGAITYHTFSRAILRPFSNKSDDEMNTEDRWTYDAIGEKGSEITGYPYVSVFHHFKYHPKEVMSGTFDDWLYEHKGIFGYTIELWDLPTAAGVSEKNDEKNFIDWFRKHPVEDDHKIFDFAAEHAPEALVDWYPFEHPQLGTIELGGWERMFSWRNPPTHLLEEEIAPQADFAISFASLAPRIAWRCLKITALGQNLYHVLAVVENQGYLSTNVSNQAKKMKVVQPDYLEIELPLGAILHSGRQRQEIGHLEGRTNKQDIGYHAASPTDNRAKVEWVMRCPNESEITVRAVSERGGTIRRTCLASDN